MIELENRRKPIEIEINENGCELLINRKAGKFGHVRIRIDGFYQMAHRIAYEQAYGRIPESKVVRHKCDNPNCINPEHLELGTHEDNVRDRVERNRSAKGTSNGRAKLTEENVRFIRNDKVHTNAELSNMFKIDRKVIRDIKNFITWRHII